MHNQVNVFSTLRHVNFLSKGHLYLPYLAWEFPTAYLLADEFRASNNCDNQRDGCNAAEKNRDVTKFRTPRGEPAPKSGREIFRYTLACDHARISATVLLFARKSLAASFTRRLRTQVVDRDNVRALSCRNPWEEALVSSSLWERRDGRHAHNFNVGRVHDESAISSL